MANDKFAVNIFLDIGQICDVKTILMLFLDGYIANNYS